jgi:hypothetical protein
MNKSFYGIIFYTRFLYQPDSKRFLESTLSYRFSSAWQTAKPRSPCMPCGPCGPVSPVSPLSPFAPVAPCGPAGPVSPFGPCGPCSPCSPCGPSGQTISIVEAPTAIALEAIIAITPKAINLPTVIEIAAIFLTSKNTLSL